MKLKNIFDYTLEKNKYLLQMNWMKVIKKIISKGKKG